MAVSPSKSSNMNVVTKDAMFLFDLFRESPTPILIQIGPFAEKTGAKPNTIIKRLAGIKARNGLNISTTLGNYKRPSASAGGDLKSQPVKKIMKRENRQPSHHASLESKDEDIDLAYARGDGSGPQSETLQNSPRPVHLPFSSASSPLGFRQNSEFGSYSNFSPTPAPAETNFTASKRDFQQTLDQESELSRSELDGTRWKRMKAE